MKAEAVGDPSLSLDLLGEQGLSSVVLSGRAAWLRVHQLLRLNPPS